jgi:precorrin-4 methylase
MELKTKTRPPLYLMAVAIFTLLAFTATPSLAQKPAPDQGHLYLVGLGAGDQDNMTVRAQKTIAGADIILALPWVREQYADLLAGKQFHNAGLTLYMKNTPHKRDPEKLKAMEDKNRAIIRQAVAQGKTVAILAGGDPMVFSPHIGYLEEFADLNPEVIPGLSCFNAANAALKKSATHGKASHSVTLAASKNFRRDYPDKDTLDKLAATHSTLVFFTMRSKFPAVLATLKEHFSGDTPIAIVCHAGYRDREKVLQATLDTIIDATKGKKLPFEHLIYLGDFLK